MVNKMTTIYLSKAVHRQIRMLAGAWNLTTSDVIIRLITENETARNAVDGVEV